jgi:diguanylate cyclase (GGDEF)-like protein
MKSHYFRIAHLLLRPLGLLSALLGVLALAGYALDAEALYRPINGGPATNPLTAMTVLALGTALAVRGRWRQVMFGPLLILALIGLGCRLADGMIGTHLSGMVTPFGATIARQLATGESNAMGLNTAAMLTLIALSVLFSQQRRPVMSQLLAFLGLAVPMVSLTGYAYGILHFYGQMSLMTASLGIMLSTAALCASAHRGVLRAILGPYIGSRIARAQVLLGYIVPFLFGFLLMRVVALGAGENLFGLFVVATSWFIVLLVVVSAVIQEKVDWRRRIAERALNFAAANDPLTSLSNRRKFFDVGRREWQRIHRNSGRLAVLMIDVDHFKRINDTAGHATGDRVLVALAKQLAASVRAVDLPARIGGEEFVVLLPDTTVEGAQVVAEQFRKRIEAMVLDPWPEQLGRVTVSIGCAGSQGKTSLDEALTAADAALYRAKNGGRNQTLVEALPAMAVDDQPNLRLSR